MKKNLLLLLLPILICNCSKPENSAISKIDIRGHEVNILHYSELDGTNSIKLSDIATDFHFIPLETNKDCMIGYAYYHIYDKYIIVVNPYEKILLFNGKGEFLRKLCIAGKGPREFQNAVTTVDEENDVLYIGDESKSYFMSWDLTNGNYLGDIPRVYSGRLKNIIFTEDNTLICAPCVGNGEAGKYYIFEQDTKGDLIREIKAPEQKGWADSNDKLLYFSGSSYNYIPINIDTIYRVYGSELIPYWMFDFGRENEQLAGKPGGRSFDYEFESDRFFVGNIFTISKVETNATEGGSSTRTSHKVEHLTIDKKTNQIYLNDKLRNDFIGEKESYLSLLKVLPNNSIYQAINAISLIEHAEKVEADPDANLEVKLRLKKLLTQIDIEDNPVLIVGELKK